MSEVFFTKKRVRCFALIGGGLVAGAFCIWAGARAELFPIGAQNILEIVFNVLMGLGAVVLIFGVVAPISMTSHYLHTQNEWLRHRVRNHFFFRQFIMEEKGSDHG